MFLEHTYSSFLQLSHARSQRFHVLIKTSATAPTLPIISARHLRERTVPLFQLSIPCLFSVSVHKRTNKWNSNINSWKAFPFSVPNKTWILNRPYKGHESLPPKISARDPFIQLLKTVFNEHNQCPVSWQQNTFKLTKILSPKTLPQSLVRNDADPT